MNITKALKLKKKLITKANTAYDKLKKYNIVEENVKPPYDAQEAYDEWIKLTNELIELKTKIHLANAPVYHKIFRMSELKSSVSKLKNLDVNNRNTNYGGVISIYVAKIDVITKDKSISVMEDEIEKLQDELEAHNAITKIG